MKVRSDGFSRFVRFGGWAAIVSGVTLVAAHMLQWLVVPAERLGTGAYLTGSYLVSASLSLLAGILLIWALIGLYAPQSRAAGTFGLWAFILAFVGAVLNLGKNWAELFVWPTLALVAPDVISGKATEAPSYLASGISLSVPLLGIGVVLFGIATFIARVYPRWAAALLIVSIPVTIFLSPTPGTFQESIGQILFAIAFAVLGWHAVRKPTPSRAEAQPQGRRDRGPEQEPRSV
jgi:hypothetical protein